MILSLSFIFLNSFLNTIFSMQKDSNLSPRLGSPLKSFIVPIKPIPHSSDHLKFNKTNIKIKYIHSPPKISHYQQKKHKRCATQSQPLSIQKQNHKQRTTQQLDINSNQVNRHRRQITTENLSIYIKPNKQAAFKSSNQQANPIIPKPPKKISQNCQKLSKQPLKNRQFKHRRNFSLLSQRQQPFSKTSQQKFQGSSQNKHFIYVPQDLQEVKQVLYKNIGKGFVPQVNPINLLQNSQNKISHDFFQSKTKITHLKTKSHLNTPNHIASPSKKQKIQNVTNKILSKYHSHRNFKTKHPAINECQNKSSKNDQCSQNLFQKIKSQKQKSTQICQLAQKNSIDNQIKHPSFLQNKKLFKSPFDKEEQKKSKEQNVKNKFKQDQFQFNQCSLQKQSSKKVKCNTLDEYFIQQQAKIVQSKLTLNTQQEIGKDKIIRQNTIKKPSIFTFQYPQINECQESTINIQLQHRTFKSLNNKSQLFDKGALLGRGNYGKVYLARHKQTGFICALKELSISYIIKENMINLIKRQISCQQFLNHQNICKLYDYFFDYQGKVLVLVIEYCPSQQLFSYIKRKKVLPESQAAAIIYQIAGAIKYMHQNFVIHRDIKPENIMISDGVIKICDFGWAVTSNQFRSTFCGTPLYMSPQIVMGKLYDARIDLWAIGVLAYQLLVGLTPFRIYSEIQMKKIVQDQVKFPPHLQLSLCAKQFILQALHKNPQKRLSIDQILRHGFLQKRKKLQTTFIQLFMSKIFVN